MARLPLAGTTALAQAGTPTTPTPTPFDSTAVSSPEFAAVAATLLAVVGALVLLARLWGR